jgi:hypothetical protein
MIKIVEENKLNTLKEKILFIISFFRYFTLWVIILDIIYYLGLIKNIELSLIYLHIFVIICSFYIFYLKKEELIIKLYKLEFKLKKKFVVILDFIFHWLPLLILFGYIYIKNKKIKNTFNVLFLLLTPILYLLINDPLKYYQFEIKFIYFLLIYVLGIFCFLLFLII